MGRERYQPSGICESIGRRIFSASHAASLREAAKPATGPRASVGAGAFPANHAPQFAAIALIVVPTISVKLLYGLIIVPAGSAGADLDQRAAHLPAE